MDRPVVRSCGYEIDGGREVEEGDETAENGFDDQPWNEVKFFDDVSGVKYEQYSLKIILN